MADYLFMNLKVRIVQNGSYLIIPVDTADGIHKDQLDFMIRSYDNPYTPSRWSLEIRPKVSYGYGESTAMVMIDSRNHIYLDQFDEQIQYLRGELYGDWKVCMSESSAELNLLRMTPGVLGFDDDERPYVEVSQAFADHIKSATFNVKCFLYNEGRRSGYTIAPNYIDPSQYIKTQFDEYLATVDSQKLKIAVMTADGSWVTTDPYSYLKTDSDEYIDDSDDERLMSHDDDNVVDEPTTPGGWVASGGADTRFGFADDLVTVGFDTDRCWIAIPTADGVAPIYEGNFRVWEYDEDNDTLGRLLCTDMEAAFPNLYYYSMQSDSPLLYIEWFRDDETCGANYDDFSKGYRDFIGVRFPIWKVAGVLAPSIQTFEPLHREYDASDFVTHLLMESSHEYRVTRMTELLQETGLYYRDMVEAVDKVNACFTTTVFKMEEKPQLWQAIQDGAPYGTLCFSTGDDFVRPYDLYIDGLHVSDTSSYWKDFHQYITVPSAKVLENSVIIVDLYDYAKTETAVVDVSGSQTNSLLPYDFALDKVAGCDLVVCKMDGTRIEPTEVEFGLYAMQYSIQIPESLIDWDALGIDKNDQSILDRMGVSRIEESDFSCLLFNFIIPTEMSYQVMKSAYNEKIITKGDEDIMVKAGDVFVDTSTLATNNSPLYKFSRKVKAQDITIVIPNREELGVDTVRVYTNNVRRVSTMEDLSVDGDVVISSFTGADDPSRLLPFINGQLMPNDEVEGTIPEKMGGDFTIHFVNQYWEGSVGEVVYLPFSVDRFDTVSNEYGELHLEGKGVMTVGSRDMIFEDGYRIPNEDLVRLTNQIIKVPKVNAVYTIIRIHRDSNMYGFNDSVDQSIMDKLILENTSYKRSLGLG
jgi:hypothetical protein